jgi:hypothetical protein
MHADHLHYGSPPASPHASIAVKALSYCPGIHQVHCGFVQREPGYLPQVYNASPHTLLTVHQYEEHLSLCSDCGITVPTGAVALLAIYSYYYYFFYFFFFFSSWSFEENETNLFVFFHLFFLYIFHFLPVIVLNLFVFAHQEDDEQDELDDFLNDQY